MSIVLIILLVVIVAVVGVSLALGRSTYEVDSARDTEYLELEGSWVRYSVMGGGPPVVLVHGWLSSSAVWENLAGRLAQRFTVYTLDLTGFGESDKPLSGYGVRYGGRLIYAFCAHFGLNRTSIIGHDLGGDMAIKLAADHPDVVGRIVLVATPANEEQIDLPTPLWAATLPVVGPIFYTLGRALRPVRSMWMRPFVSDPEDLTEDAIEDAASSTPAAMSQTLKVSMREIGGGRLARQARIIKVPVLIVAGEEDQIVDPQAAGVWARSLDQTEVCLMEECGHLPMIERVGEFNAQILAFLTGDARYLEYAERLSGKGEEQESEEEDDTASFDTREVPADREDLHEDLREDLASDETAPAFGPHPGEDPTRDGLEEDSDESAPGPPSSELDPGDDSGESEPVIRRLGDRFIDRNRDKDAEESEVSESTDETFSPGAFRESPTDESPEAGPLADETREEQEEESPRPRRRRPRREGSGSGDIVPELPNDLFDWGETLDEIKPPPKRPSSRRRDAEEVPETSPDESPDKPESGRLHDGGDQDSAGDPSEGESDEERPEGSPRS